MGLITARLLPTPSPLLLEVKLSLGEAGRVIPDQPPGPAECGPAMGGVQDSWRRRDGECGCSHDTR